MKQCTVDLPTRVESVTTRDLGCGPCLLIRFTGGRVLAIDPNQLADYEVEVALFEPEDADCAVTVVGMGFDTTAGSASLSRTPRE